MAQSQTYGQSGPQLSPDTLGSVDTYAEKLMDDIFQDIDRVMDGGSLLPKETAKPEFLALKSIKVPQLSLAPRPEIKKVEVDDHQVAKGDKKKNSDGGADRILLGAALLSVLVTSSLWVFTRGGFDQILEKLIPTDSPPPPQPVATIDPEIVANQQFAHYIERSLDLMDQKNLATKKWLGEPGALPNNSLDNLPKVSVSGRTPQELELLLPLNRIADLMESQVAKPPAIFPPAQVVVLPPAPVNIALPPSQNNQTVAQNSPSVTIPGIKVNAPSPVTKNQNSQAVANSQKNQSPLSKIASKIVEKLTPKPVYPSPLADNTPKNTPKNTPNNIPSNTSNTSNASNTNNIPNNTVNSNSNSPANSTISNQLSPAPQENVAASVVPAPSIEVIPPAPVMPVDPPQDVATATIQTNSGVNTLVGILELGDRSAALFEIDGVASRIYVGEKIGSSGWLLEKVANNEAVIRRNDEVRAVSVGAKF